MTVNDAVVYLIDKAHKAGYDGVLLQEYVAEVREKVYLMQDDVDKEALDVLFYDLF